MHADTSSERQPLTNSADCPFDGLQRVHILAYGVGHMLNDLTVTLWFYYLLYFLKEVVNTPTASLVLLIGQAIDGISILVLGPLSDRTNTRFGRILLTKANASRGISREW